MFRRCKRNYLPEIIDLFRCINSAMNIPPVVSKRDFKITHEYFNTDCTQVKLALKYGISRERVRQVISRTVRRVTDKYHLFVPDEQPSAPLVFLKNWLPSMMAKMEMVTLWDGLLKAAGILK